MANINKIKLSGVTYNIEDLYATKSVELTQAQYDALVSGGTVDPNTFYIITDAQSVDISQYYTSAQTQSAITQAVSGKVDTSSIVSSVTSASTDSEIPTAKAVYNAVEAGGGGSITIDPSFDASSTNPVANSAVTRSLTNGDGNVFKTGSKYYWQFYSVGGSSTNKGFYLDTINGEPVVKKYDTTRSLQLVETSAITSAVTSASTDSEVPSAKAVYDAIQEGGGSITVDTTLDSGSTNPVENRVIYNKIDEVEQVTARAFNELNEEVSEKQNTLVSGTNIKTINNESLLGSGNINIQGGSTYTAGRGISIANDTISFNLPISAGTGTDSIAEGFNTTASGSFSHTEGSSTRASGDFGSHAEGASTTANGICSHSEGAGTTASGNYSHVEGYNTNATNESEHASGQYNVSNKASTTFGNSGNTLFSVGNGTASNNRHNAFEIRQNGDIYLTKDGQDVKLQDQLGGSSITVDTALDSGSTNPVENRVIYNKIDEVEQVTAAGLNALNDAFGGLKLMKISQTDYDNLQVKDQNTLYIVI